VKIVRRSEAWLCEAIGGNFQLSLGITRWTVRHVNVIASHVWLSFWNAQSIKRSAPGIDRLTFCRSEAADQSVSIFIHEWCKTWYWKCNLTNYSGYAWTFNSQHG